MQAFTHFLLGANDLEANRETKMRRILKKGSTNHISDRIHIPDKNHARSNNASPVLPNLNIRKRQTNNTLVPKDFLSILENQNNHLNKDLM